MCPLEHEWSATYKVEAPLRVGFLEISRYSRHLSSAEPNVGYVYYHTIQRWTIFISSDSKKVDAALRFGFREISRYSRHLSSAEPDVGCVYHHTIQRWTISISSDSKKLTRRYGLAFEKFRDIRDIYQAPNRMSGVYTIILYHDEPSI